MVKIQKKIRCREGDAARGRKRQQEQRQEGMALGPLQFNAQLHLG
jgi:hypothetical protein